MISQIFEHFSILFADISIIFKQLLVDETLQFDVGLSAIVHTNCFFLCEIPFLRGVKLQMSQYSIKFC